MTCEVIRDLLPLCADGVASEESHAAVEEHVRHCEVCCTLYKSMCAPVEVQPAEKEPDYMAAVRRQKKENRRFLLLTYGVTLGVILLLLLGLKGRDLLRTQAWYLENVSLTAEQVAEELPQALLTREEKDLAKVIFSMPEVQAAFLAEEADPTAKLPEELYRNLLTQMGVDPSGVTGGEGIILNRSVVLDYYNDEYRCILEFIDADNSGHTDVLRKHATTRVPRVDEHGFADTSNRAPIYIGELNAALIGDTETDELSEELSTTYEKSVEKRDWLYFLKKD